MIFEDDVDPDNCNTHEFGATHLRAISNDELINMWLQPLFISIPNHGEEILIDAIRAIRMTLIDEVKHIEHFLDNLIVEKEIITNFNKNNKDNT
jgi:hypothetical protein